MDQRVERPSFRPRKTKAGANGLCPARAVLDRIGDAWSVLVVLKLRDSNMRFNALKRDIGGVSQRMLTVTLRNLERDGLVARRVFDTVPPQVEYSLTQLGHSLAAPVAVLNDWASHNQPRISAARDVYDRKNGIAAGD